MNGKDFLPVGYLMRNIKSGASTNELGVHWEISSLLHDWKKTGHGIEPQKGGRSKKKK